jgi:hypothetical protein
MVGPTSHVIRLEPGRIGAEPSGAELFWSRAEGQDPV